MFFVAGNFAESFVYFVLSAVVATAVVVAAVAVVAAVVAAVVGKLLKFVADRFAVSLIVADYWSSAEIVVDSADDSAVDSAVADLDLGQCRLEETHTLLLWLEAIEKRPLCLENSIIQFSKACTVKLGNNI